MQEFQSDHDAIITLIAEVRQIRADIKELKDGTSDRITDHEHRIRLLEETTVGKTYYDEHHEILTNQVTKLSRYIYIAIGGLMAFQIILDLYFKFK